MIHVLKTLPEYFQRTRKKEKLFEVRNNDRHFKAGDGLILKEWDGEKYTGAEISCIITYVLDGFEGINPGYVVLGVEVLIF